MFGERGEIFHSIKVNINQLFVTQVFPSKQAGVTTNEHTHAGLPLFVVHQLSIRCVPEHTHTHTHAGLPLFTSALKNSPVVDHAGLPLFPTISLTSKTLRDETGVRAHYILHSNIWKHTVVSKSSLWSIPASSRCGGGGGFKIALSWCFTKPDTVVGPT